MFRIELFDNLGMLSHEHLYLFPAEHIYGEKTVFFCRADSSRATSCKRPSTGAVVAKTQCSRAGVKVSALAISAIISEGVTSLP